jgi:hypothetical protein
LLPAGHYYLPEPGADSLHTINNEALKSLTNRSILSQHWRE